LNYPELSERLLECFTLQHESVCTEALTLLKCGNVVRAPARTHYHPSNLLTVMVRNWLEAEIHDIPGIGQKMVACLSAVVAQAVPLKLQNLSLINAY
jgi:hypothetical protein